MLKQSPCTKWDQIEAKIRDLEHIHNKYRDLSGRALPDNIRTILIIDICPKELQTHIELNQGEKDYLEIKADIVAHVNRKRSTNDNGLKTMEVDETIKRKYWDWWHSAVPMRTLSATDKSAAAKLGGTHGEANQACDPRFVTDERQRVQKKRLP